MSDTIKAALITGILGFIGTIIATYIGTQYGEKYAIIQVNSQVESEINENENLSINNVNTLIEEYNKLKTENEKYSDLQKSYDELKNQYNDLEEQNILLSKENESLREKIPNNNSFGENNNIDNTVSPTETVSIFDLDTFQGESYWFHLTDLELIDTYGNEYSNGYFTFHRSDNKYTPTYLLDYKYSKCAGKIAWPKEDKNTSGSCWIDFYYGETLVYSTAHISATDRPLSFEFSVENIETLKIICNNNLSSGSLKIIYEYLNLVP